MKKLRIALLIRTVAILMTAPVFPASYGDVVINELMWTGSFLSTADEWIELRNMTGSSIDLSDWDVTRYNGSEEVLMLTIASGKTISANGYFLISNYNASGSKINVTPDVVTTAVVLDNNKMQIKLYDGAWNGGGTLIDTADDGVGAPAAGDNVNKYAMVRGPAPGNYTPGDGTLASNWHTADRAFGWDLGATERGTPANDSALPVTVSSFSATPSDGEIILRWSTASETNIVGFHVLRSGSEQGQFIRINEAVIPGQGNTSSGKIYEYIDKDVNLDCQYWYQIEIFNTDGSSDMIGPVSARLKMDSKVPRDNRLVHNYPNPFNPSTTIYYHISEDLDPVHVVLCVYNLLGQGIRLLVNKIERDGPHFVVWDGRNDDGVETPSGVYFYQLRIGNQFAETKKMVKMK